MRHPALVLCVLGLALPSCKVVFGGRGTHNHVEDRVLDTVEVTSTRAAPSEPAPSKAESAEPLTSH